jgi:hypothetical protein
LSVTLIRFTTAFDFSFHQIALELAAPNVDSDEDQHDAALEPGQVSGSGVAWFTVVGWEGYGRGKRSNSPHGGCDGSGGIVDEIIFIQISKSSNLRLLPSFFLHYHCSLSHPHLYFFLRCSVWATTMPHGSKRSSAPLTTGRGTAVLATAVAAAVEGAGAAAGGASDSTAASVPSMAAATGDAPVTTQLRVVGRVATTTTMTSTMVKMRRIEDYCDDDNDDGDDD